jgi:hypothetical protein
VASQTRKEIDAVLDGRTYTVRPTLERVAEIEDRFGSVLSVLRKMQANDIGVGVLCGIFGIMLRGAKDSAGVAAPPYFEVVKAAFDAGAYATCSGPVSAYLAAAIAADDPATAGATAGN